MRSTQPAAVRTPLRPVVVAGVLALRPQQWTKNVLVLAGVIFADQLFVPGQVLRALALFAAFCLVSGATYIFNDLRDLESDRVHARKRNRPIASGAVSAGVAIGIAAGALIAGFALASVTTKGAVACLIGYVILQVSYTLLLKHAVILDVMAIASGFVLRAISGTFAVEVAISPWLWICSTLLALLLALGKRRTELLASQTAPTLRKVLADYNAQLIDQLIAVVGSCTVLAYFLYAFSEQTSRKFPSHLMPLTLPFVIYGLFRYLYLLYRRSEGEEPEALLVKDVPLLLDVILWGMTVVLISVLGN